MIDTLLPMHNIKYVISVDDCFFAPRIDVIRAAVYEKMCESITEFKDTVFNGKYVQEIGDIESMISIGADASPLISEFVNSLDEDDLRACYARCEESGTAYASERSGIESFLSGLKDSAQIIDYRLIPSTTEAQKFDYKSAGMTDGAILWLIDRNFLRVGESADAGITLAQGIASRDDNSNNYIFILSAVEDDSGKEEDEIEKEFDTLLVEKLSSEDPSLIYYINKQRVLDNDTEKIAKSLLQGFKRKACFQLFQTYTDCMADSQAETVTKIQSVRQRTLDYLFVNKVQKCGESYTDFAARFTQIFWQEEYNRAIAEKIDEIARRTRYYEKLSSLLKISADEKAIVTPDIAQYRKLELYNDHINAQYCEVTTGDVFNIAGKYYLLASQACDTYLRSDGQRKLKVATLLEIRDIEGKEPYSYKLSCFLDMKKPAVIYHSVKMIPFELLDLCVYNPDGQATVSLEAEAEKPEKVHTVNYCKRYLEIKALFKKIFQAKKLVDAYFGGDKKISVADAKEAYDTLENVDPQVKDYQADGNWLTYPVKRVFRLSELMTIDVVEKYGTIISRMGHPFDFLT